MDQPFNNSIGGNVITYLVLADDQHRHRGMLVVRYNSSFEHLSITEWRKIKRMKEREEIRMVSEYRAERWHLIMVPKVDLPRERRVVRWEVGPPLPLDKEVPIRGLERGVLWGDRLLQQGQIHWRALSR
jgi:hypothetical protein